MLFYLSGIQSGVYWNHLLFFFGETFVYLESEFKISQESKNPPLPTVNMRTLRNIYFTRFFFLHILFSFTKPKIGDFIYIQKKKKQNFILIKVVVNLTSSLMGDTIYTHLYFVLLRYFNNRRKKNCIYFSVLFIWNIKIIMKSFWRWNKFNLKLITWPFSYTQGSNHKAILFLKCSQYILEIDEEQKWKN